MASVTPCSHQVRAFQRYYDPWRPTLPSTDEFGFDKTIQAVFLLQRALLAGRSNRIPILAPRAFIWQSQIELREKVNRNWPIRDGRDSPRSHRRPCGVGTTER